MRLIDADHVLKRNGLDHAGKYHKDGHINREALDTMMLYEVKAMIDEAPTVDAIYQNEKNMNIDNTVKILNILLMEVCAHGGDIGGIYASNEVGAREAMKNIIEHLGLDGYVAGFDKFGWPEIIKMEDS